MESVRIRKTKSAHEPYALMLRACRAIADDDRPAHNARNPPVENLRRAALAARRLSQLDGPHCNLRETLALLHHRLLRSSFQILHTLTIASLEILRPPAKPKITARDSELLLRCNQVFPPV